MHYFRKYLTKEQIFTIPNVMSLFRLVLTPFIIWTYWTGNYDIAAGLLLLSALTDILDGVIARKFDMVSDLGKMIDPLCDKVTHAALLVCLVRRYSFIWLVFGLLVVKELTIALLAGLMVKRRDEIHGAKWYGKLCTVVFETVMLVLIVFPTLPELAVLILLGICCAAMLLSFVMYMIFFLRRLRRGDRT